MSVNQQQHPIPRRLQFTNRDRGTTRFAAVSTLGLVVVIVAVAALFARGGAPSSNNTPLQSLGALAAQDQSTPETASTPRPAMTASVAWELDSPMMQFSSSGDLKVADGRVFQQLTFDSDDDSLDFSGLRALDIDTGDVIWQQSLDSSRAGVEADEHGVYSVVDLQTIDARDPATGDALWTLDLSFPIVSTILDNGVLYVWDSDNRMSAINTETGSTIWQSEPASNTPYETMPDGVPFPTDLHVGGNVVVSLDADSTLHAFNLSDGTVEWSIPDLDWHYVAMYTTGDTLLVILPPDGGSTSDEGGVANPDRNAIAVDMFTGKTAWEAAMISPFHWSGSSREGGKFFILADSVTVNSQSSNPIVDAVSSIVWPEWTPTAAERQGYPPGAPHVFALDAATGQIDWQQTTGAGDFYGLGGATTNGIWAVTADQQIVLLSADTGALLAQPVVLQGESVNGLFSGPSDYRLIVSGRGGILIGIRTDPI